MNIKKHIWYWAGGGDQDITPNIYGYSKDRTTVTVISTNSDASVYTFERATQSDYSDATQVQSSSSRILNDTGLTGGVTYYYRVKGDNSSWVSCSIKTCPFDPVFWVTGIGAKNGANNDYATCTGSSFDVMKSIINTSLTFTNVGATKATIGQNQNFLDSPAIINSNSNGYRTTGTPSLTISSGWSVVLDGVFLGAAVNSYLLSKNGGAVGFIRFTTNANPATALVSVSGASRTITFSGPITTGIRYTIVITCDSSGNLLGSIDGGQTWSAPITAIPLVNLDFDQFFIANGGGSPVNLLVNHLVGVNQVLTSTEVDYIKNYPKGSTFVPRANTTLVPSGLTFANTLPADSIIVDARLGNVCSSSYVRDRLWVYGDYSYQLLNFTRFAPYYQQDALLVVNLATGKYEDLILLPIRNSDATDTHASGSLPPMYDNTIIQKEANAHYDKITHMLMKGSTFKDSMDLSGYDEPVIKGGIDVQEFLDNLQYYQFNIVNDKIAITAQEWNSSGYAEHITYCESDDNGLNYKKLRIAATQGAGYWFYHKMVYREDGVIDLFLNNYDIAGSRYPYLFHLRSINDGITWTNIQGTFSKNVQTSGPVTFAELTANCIVKDASALSADAFTYYAAYDPNTSELFGLTLNGSNTAIQMFRWSGGSWNLTNVDFGATTMNYSSIGDSYDPHFFIIKTGANSFDVYAASDNSGNNQIVKVSTSDNGSNWGGVSVFSTDNTKRFQRFYPNRNVQYSGRKVVGGSIEVNVASDIGSYFQKEVV